MEVYRSEVWPAICDQRSMDPSLMYEAVKQGGVDVISAFTTDARILAVRSRASRRRSRRDSALRCDYLGRAAPFGEEPKIVHALESLEGLITTRLMRRDEPNGR